MREKKAGWCEGGSMKEGNICIVHYLFFNLIVYDYIELNNRDFPNGWAPLQHMIVEGLGRSESKKARSVAEDIAVRWIRTNYVGYKKTGTMHEKYDVEKCGDGGGGEYAPQVCL